jgi:hypothetical protein
MQRSRPPILAATRQLTNLTVPYGQPREPPDDDEGREMRKLRAEMHRRMLGDGYCARPVEMDGHFESICESAGAATLVGQVFRKDVEQNPFLLRDPRGQDCALGSSALRTATAADLEFVFELRKSVMGEYIGAVCGWDEADQRASSSAADPSQAPWLTAESLCAV